MKKEARLSARALAEVEVGRGEEDLRCKSLFIVCQRRRGLSEVGVILFFWMQGSDYGSGYEEI